MPQWNLCCVVFPFACHTPMKLGRFPATVALAAALALCSIIPVTSVPTVVDVFKAGDEAGVKQFRIPALVATGRGTLLAFAEARTDPAVDCGYKWIVVRRSTDNGTTWGPSIPVAGAGTPRVATGNPQAVYHGPSGRVVVTYGAKALPPANGICSPGDAVYVVDDGGSDGVAWGPPRNISGSLGPQWGGILPGPGAGVVTAVSHPGRIVFSGTLGPYIRDVAYYSDDGGASWTPSGTSLPHMNESCPAELPDGTLYLSMRNDHATKCDCQAYAVSKDGGATWALPIAYDDTLVSPVCEGSVAVAANGRMYFANPASASRRQDITIRRTLPGSLRWEEDTYLVAPGETFGGYTSLVVSPGVATPQGVAGGILFERNTTATAVISFALFPLEF